MSVLTWNAGIRKKIEEAQSQSYSVISAATCSGPTSEARPFSTAFYTPPTEINREEDEGDDINCSIAPPHALKVRRWLEATAYQSYLNGSPRVELLISLSRLNVHRAFKENIIAIGMSAAWLKDDDSISIFNFAQAGPEFWEDRIPLSLRPTEIQRKIPHHPCLDVSPFPGMRDIMILAGDALNEDEQCHDNGLLGHEKHGCDFARMGEFMGSGELGSYGIVCKEVGRLAQKLPTAGFH